MLPQIFQGIPVYPAVDGDMVVIPPAALSPLCDGYVLQRRQALFFSQALDPPDVITQEAGGLLVALRLYPVGQVDLQILRGKIGVQFALQFFLPVPLVELLLGLRGRLPFGPLPAATLSRFKDRVDKHVQVLPTDIFLFTVYCPHT